MRAGHSLHSGDLRLVRQFCDELALGREDIDRMIHVSDLHGASEHRRRGFIRDVTYGEVRVNVWVRRPLGFQHGKPASRLAVMPNSTEGFEILECYVLGHLRRIQVPY